MNLAGRGWQAAQSGCFAAGAEDLQHGAAAVPRGLSGLRCGLDAGGWGWELLTFNVEWLELKACDTALR